jgi:hypothetical protein
MDIFARASLRLIVFLLLLLYTIFTMNKARLALQSQQALQQVCIIIVIRLSRSMKLYCCSGSWQIAIIGMFLYLQLYFRLRDKICLTYANKVSPSSLHIKHMVDQMCYELYIQITYTIY